VSGRNKFFADAQMLTNDIVRPDGAFGLVRPMMNVWAVFVPSNEVGVSILTFRAMTHALFHRAGSEITINQKSGSVQVNE
jgi:hypothetical protein